MKKYYRADLTRIYDKSSKQLINKNHSVIIEIDNEKNHYSLVKNYCRVMGSVKLEESNKLDYDEAINNHTVTTYNLNKKIKKMYEVSVEVEKYYESDYDFEKKESIDILVPFLNEDGEESGEAPWFYKDFRSRKDAIKYFKMFILSNTASQINVSLKEEYMCRESKILFDAEPISSMYISNEDINIKKLAKELRKVK